MLRTIWYFWKRCLDCWTGYAMLQVELAVAILCYWPDQRQFVAEAAGTTWRFCGSWCFVTSTSSFLTWRSSMPVLGLFKSLSRCLVVILYPARPYIPRKRRRFQQRRSQAPQPFFCGIIFPPKIAAKMPTANAKKGRILPKWWMTVYPGNLNVENHLGLPCRSPHQHNAMASGWTSGNVRPKATLTDRISDIFRY